MKILFFTHYAALYGANRSLLNLIDGLENYPVEVRVVIPEEGELAIELEKRNKQYIIQSFYRWSVRQDDPIFRLKFLKTFRIFRSNRRRRRMNYYFVKKLRTQLDSFHPEIICSNSTVFDFGFLFSRHLKKPHIWILRESQEQYNLKWLYGLKRVNRTFKRSELIVAVSSFLKEYYEKKNALSEIRILYNGVLSSGDLKLLDIRKKEKNKHKKRFKTFGIVGLIHPNKGQEEAIRAFSLVRRRFNNIRLIVVGTGEVNSLKSLTDELGVSGAVEFWGYLEDPFEAFLEMDVCLMCSRMEGLGRVTLEAMATSVPVIGYKEGGTKELIKENFNGLFYENGQEELANRMIYFLENEEEIQRMGQNGRRDFEEKFTSEVYARNFLELIKTAPAVSENL